MAARSHKLAWIITRRLVVIAFLAMIIQLAYVIFDYSRRTDEVAEAIVDRELDLLEDSIDPTKSGMITLVPPPELEARYEKYPRNYGFQLLDSNGQTIAERNPGIFVGAPESINGANALRSEDRIDDQQRRFGSRSILVGDHEVELRTATIGDPAKVYLRVIWEAILDHVTLPIVPLTVLMLVAVWVVLRQTLRPVERAALAVSSVDPLEGAPRLKLDGAPEEVVTLGSAVNRLLDRLDQSLISHRDFAANVAHELRTPLALLKLELDGLPDNIADKARSDVDSMIRLVEQLLNVARLESFDAGTMETVDLAAVSADVVTRLAPAAIDGGCNIALDVLQPICIEGHSEAIVSALRNLVENALRVSPRDSQVMVRVGPGPRIRVIDRGPGIPKASLDGIFERYRQGDRKARGSAGLGLSIVKRTMELHGGTVDVTSRPEFTVFTLNFADSRVQSERIDDTSRQTISAEAPNSEQAADSALYIQ